MNGVSVLCCQSRHAAAVDEISMSFESVSLDTTPEITADTQPGFSAATQPGISTAVPGYEFTADLSLLDGNFIPGLALHDPVYDESFGGCIGADNQFDADSLLAVAANSPTTIDVSQYEDLMVFH